MNLFLRKYVSFLLLLIPIGFSGLEFKPLPTEEDLNLMDTNRVIENSIHMYVSNSVYLRIKEISGHKQILNKPLIVINADSLDSEKVHTRGKTTLHLRRKSFSFSLKDKVSLFYSGEIQKFKKFYAISLSMDNHYIRNRISFGMMKEIELFDLFYSFSELKINDHHEGIYMLIERPQDWALNKKHSPCIIRRGYGNKIDKLRSGNKIEKTEIQSQKQKFKQIYKVLDKYEGEVLYAALSQMIDLDMYMKWLAFNFYVRNGDYTDEVYFYIDPVTLKYKIIPWDYDDIFAKQPHEGTEKKMQSVGHTLIFSSEDRLDQKIASDPFLYQIYLNQLSVVLNELTADRIKHILKNTYAELYPYYKSDEIINMSKYDENKNVSLESLKAEFQKLYYILIMHRNNCLIYLEGKSKNIAH